VFEVRMKDGSRWRTKKIYFANGLLWMERPQRFNFGTGKWTEPELGETGVPMDDVLKVLKI